MVRGMGQFMNAHRGFRTFAQLGKDGSHQHVGNIFGTV